MKKLFLVGALAASMAFSSSALAAVEYNDAGTLDITYDGASTISVETDLSTYGDQMTIIIVDGDGNTISDSNIMYIDQTASGAGIFKNMGLLMPTEKNDEGEDVPLTALPVGVYTIIVGGTNLGTEAVPLLKATLTVAEGEDGPTYTLGDVVVDGKIDINDVGAVLNAYLGNITLDATQKLAADVAPKGNVDGKIDINDVGLVLNVYLGNSTFE